MSYPPTDEQQAIIDAFLRGEHLSIEAGAGTGKTSTLKFLAAAVPMYRGNYMAYNAAIAREAATEFPSNVTCKTGHGHTMAGITDTQRERLFNMGAQFGPEVARILGIAPGGHRVTDDVVYAGRQVARVALATVERFARSADDDVQPKHIPVQTRLESPAAKLALAELVLPYARAAWKDILSPTGRLRWTHDYYRKVFQLEGRILPGRFLMVDEAQDCSGVTIGMVRNHQKAGQKIVVVGDRQQAINRWMDAVDAMDEFGGTHLSLSKSFRFGPLIADEANKWLTLLDAQLRITGHEPVGSTVGPLTPPMLPDAILTRSNAEAVAAAMRLQKSGHRVALVKGIGEQITALAKAAMELKETGSTSNPELCAFTSWGQVQEYVESDHGGGDLAVFVKLIDEHTPETVIEALKGVVSEKSAQITLSTAHRSKGREWDTVRIAGDFHKPKDDGTLPARDELMLAYVAVTRAKKHLDLGGLAWINDYLPGDRAAVGPWDKVAV